MASETPGAQALSEPFVALDAPTLAWLRDLDPAIPEGLARAAGWTPVNGRLPMPHPGLGPDAATLVRLGEGLRLWRAYTRPPTSARLPVPYHAVPVPLRMAIARLQGAWKRRSVDRWARFPGFPLDLTVDALFDLASDLDQTVAVTPPWRDGPTPVLLSHDIDSAEGLANLERQFLDREEAVGARSMNFIVPRAWPLDHAALERIRGRGHALGIHGYEHANRTPFAEPDERRRRLDAAGDLIARYDIKGYRAPSLARSPALLADLADRYAWDSSIPTSGGLFPVPNNGCATARPFWIGTLLEIPLSMPRDGSLRFLGYRPEAIADLWITCAERIARAGGVVVLLTHCEARFSGNAPMLAAYGRFLDHVAASPALAFSTFEAVSESAGAQAGVVAA